MGWFLSALFIIGPLLYLARTILKARSSQAPLSIRVRGLASGVLLLMFVAVPFASNQESPPAPAPAGPTQPTGMGWYFDPLVHPQTMFERWVVLCMLAAMILLAVSLVLRTRENAIQDANAMRGGEPIPDHRWPPGVVAAITAGALITLYIMGGWAVQIALNRYYEPWAAAMPTNLQQWQPANLSLATALIQAVSIALMSSLVAVPGAFVVAYFTQRRAVSRSNERHTQHLTAFRARLEHERVEAVGSCTAASPPHG